MWKTRDGDGGGANFVHIHLKGPAEREEEEEEKKRDFLRFVRDAGERRTVRKTLATFTVLQA